MRERGIIVYLTAAPGVILERTEVDKAERPLLKMEDKLRQIRELLRFRKPFYERATDIRINTSRRSVNSVAEQIINQVQADESHH